MADVSDYMREHYLYCLWLWLFERFGACEHVSARYPNACRNTFTLECTIICFTVNIKKEQGNLTVVKDNMQNVVTVP